MRRRHFVGACGALATHGAWAQPAAAGFDQLLDSYAAEADLVEASWAFRDATVSRGVGMGTPSSRPISARASDMIVRLEVGGQQRYERLYQAPIWPKGRSGVTIGIGYDLRFASRELLRRDWGTLLPEDTIATLEKVIRIGGTAAEEALPQVADVRVPWLPAMTQFRQFLPYVVADTEGVFPNCDRLSPDSLGALVSLVYNRGPGVQRNKPDRAEMVRVRELMADQAFKEIPEQIRAMKRLWTTPDARGLVTRRELEAQLFEQGLAA